MRFFGNKQNDNTTPGDPDSNDVDPDLLIGENNDPGPQGDPVQLADLTGVNLDDIYDPQTGEPLYELDGQACDMDGNPIPDSRPDVQPPAPVVVTPPAREPVVLQSPLATSVFSDVERAEAAELFGERGLAFLETAAARTADRIVQARDQSRIAARQLGVAADAVDEYAHRISQMEQYIPASMRGTKEGSTFAMALAAAHEANETGGDLGAVFRKLGGAAPGAQATPITPAPKRQNVAMPPSAVTTTPMATPESVRMGPARRPQRLVAGLTEEQRKAIGELSSSSGVRI